MKNTKIAHKRQDGGVSITVLAIDLTPDEIQQHIKELESSNSDFVNSRIVLDSQLPSDRVFRNAWTDDLNTPTIDIDVPKAQDIKKDLMREIRKPLLEALDIDYMKAIEQNDDEKKATIVAQKQELRDVTDLELPTKVSELMDFMPDCLKS